MRRRWRGHRRCRRRWHRLVQRRYDHSFGSIFVNGIRYQDNGARLVDDDGIVKVLGTDDNPLKIGMAVEVTGSVDDRGTMRSAMQIAYGAEIKGPVTSVDAVAGTFNVFGITVRTTTTTVYDNFGGVGSLAGQCVEVLARPTQMPILASYLERKAASVAAFVAVTASIAFAVPWTVCAESSPTYALTLGGVALRLSQCTDFDGTPANGRSVTVTAGPVAMATCVIWLSD